jgi:anti-anti-sigma regulatory factor
VLRITLHHSSRATTLKLEGKLLGPWVQELREAVLAARTKSHPVQLDLKDLDYADLAGAELLRELVKEGATIATCSGFVAELLERNRTR